MSLVVPFERCVARPDREDGTIYPLSEHLHAVGIAWAAGRSLPCGSLGGNQPLECSLTCTPVCRGYAQTAAERALLFLGGLLHDAGKARQPWQRYIRSNPEHRGGIIHAPSGAALFFYLSHKFLCLLDKELCEVQLTRSRDLMLHRVKVAVDISDHHGELSDIDLRPPWEQGGFSGDHLAEIDLMGLASFVSQSMGYDLPIDLEECMDYLNTTGHEWTRVSTVSLPRQRRRIETSPSRYQQAALSCVRLETARFIAGDRYHAGGLEPVYLTEAVALGALEHLEEMLASKAREALSKGASANLVGMRQEAQDAAIAEYIGAREQNLFSLCLPTGMGKTMAALRVALTACAIGEARRIVYVAPYLSILSQATDEMRKATRLQVLQHHHLSTVKEVDLAEDDDSLLLESWQAPIVTTTFHQLFLALFPKKAQHSMRLRALEGAFIIVDEPQVIDKASWKVFLHMIEALTKRANAKVLFTTATMPPIQGGLSQPPHNLVVRTFDLPPRYKIQYEPGELDASTAARRAVENLRADKNVAVVMSTIGGAAAIYEAIERELSKWSNRKAESLFFLSGALSPVHKAHVINKAKESLRDSCGIGVVSTQVIEAGVDLSFHHIYREIPVIPSIVQVAGRANRHGEKDEPAIVTVFDYVDEGGHNKRQYVYKSSIWREETDRLLNESRDLWTETETSSVLSSFYRACFERSPDEAFLSYLIDGACGVWSSLRKMKPFDEDVERVSVFVPWEGPLPEYLRRAMSAFGLSTPEEVYDRYLEPGFLQSLSFARRKLFMSILQSMSVPLTFRKARAVADSGGNKSIWRLFDQEKYHPVTGLSKVVEGDVSIGIY